VEGKEDTVGIVGQSTSGMGLEGWGLLVAVAGVVMAALGLAYAVARHRREDARRRAALEPFLEISIEERTALASPPGSGTVLGPPGAGGEGVLEVALANPPEKERPVRPVAMDLVAPSGGRVSLSGMEGDVVLGEEIAPGDRVRFWLPLEHVAWVLSELGNSGGGVPTHVEVRDALGNVHSRETTIDVDRWSPPPPSPASGTGRGPYRPGEEVVFWFPLEHEEEVEEILAIYEHRGGAGPSDVYLWGHMEVEAAHGGVALSWVDLSGEIPRDAAPGPYDRIYFKATYRAGGTVDLDERLAPETIEVADPAGREETPGEGDDG